MTITIGIDPHKASHTAVAVDNTECVLDELRVRACAAQTDRLRSWAAPFPDRVWAIESARGLGYLLAQQLVAAGETVVDVPAVLSTRTRLLGSGREQKNDPNDARSVAIAALRTDGLARVGVDEHAQVLKLLAKRHRDLGRLRGKAACRIHALLMELQPGGMAQRMNVTRANALLDEVVLDTEMAAHRVGVAREFVADLAHYEAQMKTSKARLRHAIAATSTSLTDIRGVGVVTAAMIIGHVGDVSRFKLPLRGTRVLRPQTRRGQERQRSDPVVEASTLQRHLPVTHRRRSPTRAVIGRPGRTIRNDTKSSVTGSTS